jgi:hypothetical protein
MIQPDWNENLKSLPNFGHVFLSFFNGAWKLFSPSGSLVSTDGTTSNGLNEALVYATANNYGLHVHKGVIHSTSPVYIPPNHNFSFRCDAELNLQNTGDYSGIWMDSSRTGKFDFNAGINYYGSGSAVELYGLNPDPVDGINQVDGNRISFTNITAAVNTYHGIPTCQKVLHLHGAINAAGWGNVSHNTIIGTSLTGGVNSLVFDPPNLNDRGFTQEHSLISISQIVYFQQSGVYFTHNGGLANNNFVTIGVIWGGGNDGTRYSTNKCIYMGGSAQSNLISCGNIDANPSINTPRVAIQFDDGAGSNRITSGTITGTSVLGSNPTNYVLTNAISTEINLVVGTSPWTWVNPYPFDVQVIISGGNGVVTQVSPGSYGTDLFYNCGGTNAMFYIPVAGAIKVVYTDFAPLAYLFARVNPE